MPSEPTGQPIEPEPTFNPTTIFCDEAGFTGNNLLDASQEVFAFAGVALTHDEAKCIVERTIANFRLQGRELKGRRLLRTEPGRRAIGAVIKQCAPHTRVVFHLKKYALACKFFEYIFEPALAEQNSIYYASGFHSFISTLLFVHLRVRKASAETIFEEFSRFMREGDQAALEKLFPSGGLVVDYTSNPLAAISVFAMLNRRVIIEELETVRGEAVVDPPSVAPSQILFHNSNSWTSQQHYDGGAKFSPLASPT